MASSSTGSTSSTGGADGRAGIDAGLVGQLLAEQFPQWAGLPIRPVEVDGWDNRTYRLGDALTVRLPTAEGYVAGVEKENTWLPRLAAGLPVAVPEVVGLGEPGCGYPFPWSVRRWLPGRTADRALIGDLDGLAVAVAGFIAALQRCDPSGGPAAGRHSWWRGAPPARYDEETRRCLDTLAGRGDAGIDLAGAREVWAAALAATWRGSPVWFHGDIAPGNLLLVDDRLSAVIDFGTSGVGDPACDLVITWTFFAGADRSAFVDAVGASVGVDDAMWARARGWALWKALLGLTGALRDKTPDGAAIDRERAVIDAVVTSGR